MSLARILEAAAEALRPPPDLTVSEWAGGVDDDPATAHRVLPDDEAEPGPWRNRRTPYLVEIMDRLSPQDPAQEVVFMKGSQIGGTEVGLNWLGFLIHNSPSRIMVVQPGLGEAKDFSRQRLQKLIDLTPALRGKISDARSRDGSNNTFLKEFPGGSLKLAGANAAAALRSKPIRCLFGDEIDNWTDDADGEGDPLYLAEKRLGTFQDRKSFLCSTPNERMLNAGEIVQGGSRIERRFLEGDRRLFHVPCPACGGFQVLAWDGIVIPKGEDGKRHADQAYYRCAHCDHAIQNRDKGWMLAHGSWEPAALEDVRRVLGWSAPDLPQSERRRSFHLSSLYSPDGWLSWGEIAAEFLRVKDDPIQLKTFINTVLGQTWDQEGGASLDAADLEGRGEDWRGKVPEGVRLITAGVDVQKDRLEAEIVGWGTGFESWSLDYVVIPGDVTGAQVWEDLDDVLSRAWEQESGGLPLGVAAACVDAGYEQKRVVEFCHARWNRRVWAIKGKEGDRPIWPLKWSLQADRNARGKFKIVGVDEAKRHVYTALAKREAGPAFCHFPQGRPAWWFRQLTAERMTEKIQAGVRRVVWTKPANARNEALDCRVYAYAAAVGLDAIGRGLAKAAKVAQAGGRPRRVDRRPAERDDRPEPTRGRKARKRRERWIPRRDEW